MNKTIELSDISEAALDAAGDSVIGVAIWLRDAIIENFNGNNRDNHSLAAEWSRWNGISHVIEVYGEGPGNEGAWSGIWADDVTDAVEAELNDMMRDRISDDFGDRISRSEDLNELASWLKAADAWAKDVCIDVESIYDATDLPSFSNIVVTGNVFSWEDTRVLLSGSEGWIIEDRRDHDAA